MTTRAKKCEVGFGTVAPLTVEMLHFERNQAGGRITLTPSTLRALKLVFFEKVPTHVVGDRRNSFVPCLKAELPSRDVLLVPSRATLFTAGVLGTLRGTEASFLGEEDTPTLGANFGRKYLGCGWFASTGAR